MGLALISQQSRKLDLFKYQLLLVNQASHLPSMANYMLSDDFSDSKLGIQKSGTKFILSGLTEVCTFSTSLRDEIPVSTRTVLNPQLFPNIMSVFNLNWSIYKIKLENKTKKQWQVSNNAELEYVKGIGNSLETIQPQNKGILQLAVNVFHAIVLLKGKQNSYRSCS